ncbi:MAG: rubredoxin [Nitrospirota bacterium]|nr:rubredoxin [Nitrospirota bacterium]
MTSGRHQICVKDAENRVPRFSNNIISEEAMMWRCTICGYIYDDAKEGTKFEDLPGDWTCPVCNAPKDAFVRM